MKIIGNIILFIIIVLVFGYIAFLTLLPIMIDKKLDSSTIIKNVFEITKLNAEFGAPKAYTTNNLGIGLKFKEVNITYPDNKDFLKAGKIEIEVAALPLLFKTIKFNKIEATAPTIDLIILPTKEYKINDFLKQNFNAGVFTNNCPKLSKYTFDLSPITLTSYTILESNLATNKNEKLTGAEQVTPRLTAINYLKPYFQDKENKPVINIQ